ncbi:MAG: hypothetical protein NT027_02200 [Proteobacteria bacterium]|nr:hypothetical protein [Pseudomonadota bacterium]
MSRKSRSGFILPINKSLQFADRIFGVPQFSNWQGSEPKTAEDSTFGYGKAVFGDANEASLNNSGATHSVFYIQKACASALKVT